MPATPDPLQGRSNAKRKTLAAPVDALDRTIGDLDTFADLEDLEAETATATRDSLVSTSTATRESLSS